jgi:hypothetical protein
MTSIVKYGNGGCVYVCSAVTTDGGDFVPNTTSDNEEYWQFWTPKIKDIEEALMKIKQLSGGSSYSNKDGKRNWSIDLTDCYVVKNAQATPTAERNAIKQFFRKHTKAGATAVYMFVYNEADSTYLSLGAVASCATFTRYLKGYVTRYLDELSMGNLYKFDLHMQECLS